MYISPPDRTEAHRHLANQPDIEEFLPVLREDGLFAPKALIVFRTPPAAHRLIEAGRLRPLDLQIEKLTVRYDRPAYYEMAR